MQVSIGALSFYLCCLPVQIKVFMCDSIIFSIVLGVSQRGSRLWSEPTMNQVSDLLEDIHQECACIMLLL